MSFDVVRLHRIWSETDCYLNTLTRAVREGHGVDEASNFSRWLQFSGVLQLLKPFEQEVPLPIKAADLSRKCQELVYECGEWYRKHERSRAPRDAYVSRSKLDEIEAQMRVMAEQLQRLSAPLTENTENVGDSSEPALRVIRGAA